MLASISLLPRVIRSGQPMDMFRRLGAPTPISLNDGLSFKNNNSWPNGWTKLFELYVEPRGNRGNLLLQNSKKKCPNFFFNAGYFS